MFGEKIKFLGRKAKGFDDGSLYDPHVKSLSERILSDLRSLSFDIWVFLKPRLV